MEEKEKVAVTCECWNTRRLMQVIELPTRTALAVTATLT